MQAGKAIPSLKTLGGGLEDGLRLKVSPSSAAEVLKTSGDS